MDLKETISLSAPTARVWSLIGDVEAVADCIPGAELVTDCGDNTYEGRMVFTLGPKRVRFSGTVVFESDDATIRGRLIATGCDASGTSRASGRVEYWVEPASDRGECVITVVSTVQFFGPLSDFAELGGLHVGRRILGEFAACIGQTLEASPAQAAALVRTEPMSGIRLALGAFWEWTKKVLRQEHGSSQACDLKRD